MPTNLDGLKAIYVAVGGSEDDVAATDTNADLMQKIAQKISESGVFEKGD